MKYILLFFLALGSLYSFSQNQNPSPNHHTLTLKPNSTIGKDAAVWSNGVTNNYGNASAINVYTWTNGGVLGVKRAYLAFDLSSIPANAILDSVFLRLFYDPMTNEGFTTHSGTTEMIIKRVTSSWSESTINWNNQPTTSSINSVSVPAHSSSTQNYHIEVTQLVSDMLQRGNINYGFQVRMQNEVNYYRGVLLASSDHSNSTLHPELSINYHLPITTGINRSILDSNQVLVYPNPAENIVKLENLNSKGSNNRQVQLFDMLGKELDISVIDSQVDLSQFPPGIYFFRFTDENGQVLTKKIILK